MIDLHLHTSASDGRLQPADLVRRAADTGITVLSVTDHDTVAGLAEARRAAENFGIRVVDGIEITAVHDGKDVHVLGYFIDIDDQLLAEFLRTQRIHRVERVREIAERLARLNVGVDVEPLLAAAARDDGRSIGRPTLALALVAAGHVATIQQAFDLYLATGRPAFVPRVGPTPLAVLAAIHDGRGLASMAHPGVTAQPAVLASLVDAGLDAIEVHHSDHSPELRRELAEFAIARRLLISGGSDFHGDDDRGRMLGGVSLPTDDFARLEEAGRARWTS